ncbi:uncharacterized protein Bfra_000180 [Botrytis fragariae]|uniref:Uncharacterized protein n=1 Tax=Botrytis fragariae TaxID=1964551 RepID=A0A8H6B2I8_9HELO|nr:uncharacterized protein Bfra_000180 [Botrytis fragariae]KAF5878014.1 hypothetical protein Bfra_000180 [Botrytis fragariae]
MAEQKQSRASLSLWPMRMSCPACLPWTINSQLTTLYPSWLEPVVLEPLKYDLCLAVQAFSSKNRQACGSMTYLRTKVSADTGSGKGNQLATTLAGRLKA